MYFIIPFWGKKQLYYVEILQMNAHVKKKANWGTDKNRLGLDFKIICSK